jgi:membrane protein implicated in regulation of membrane protease activity
MAVLTIGLLLLGVSLLMAPARRGAKRWVRPAGMGALIAALILVPLQFGGLLWLALGLGFLVAVVPLTVVIVRTAWQATRRPVQCGAEGLVGHVGMVRRSLDPLGEVAVGGELWRARRSWGEEDQLAPAEGDAVVIEAVHGLTLRVRQAEPWEVDP